MLKQTYDFTYDDINHMKERRKCEREIFPNQTLKYKS